MRIVQLGFPAERVEDTLARAREVFPSIPGVKSFWGGYDGSELALLIGFDTAEAIAPYVGHPTHRGFVDEWLSPYATSKRVSNFEG